MSTHSLISQSTIVDPFLDFSGMGASLMHPHAPMPPCLRNPRMGRQFLIGKSMNGSTFFDWEIKEWVDNLLIEKSRNGSTIFDWELKGWVDIFRLRNRGMGRLCFDCFFCLDWEIQESVGYFVLGNQGMGLHMLIEKSRNLSTIFWIEQSRNWSTFFDW